MTKDEIYQEGRRLNVQIDRRKPRLHMLGILQSAKGSRGELVAPEEGVGPVQPKLLRNKRTGHVWPFRLDWASNPEMEPLYEDP